MGPRQLVFAVLALLPSILLTLAAHCEALGSVLPGVGTISDSLSLSLAPQRRSTPGGFGAARDAIDAQNTNYAQNYTYCMHDS